VVVACANDIQLVC